MIAQALPDQALRLADGRTVRLAGLDAESLRLPSFENEEATLIGAGPPDRHGAVHADLVVEGLSLSERLTAEGKARIRPRPGETACYAALLAAEDAARRGGLGLWAEPAYAVADASDPEAVAPHEGRFAIVSGRVAHAGASGATLWIDFGAVWRTDVTLAIPKREGPRFAASGVAPETLVGQMIRARGVVTAQGGPRIDITEPAAIERIDAPAR